MSKCWRTKYNIEPLHGENYDTWKFRVWTLLIKEQLHGMIEKKYRDSDYDDANKRYEARKRDNKVKLIIVQCISDSQLKFVRDEDTAYQMWRNLEIIYEKEGLDVEVFFKKKLMSLKMRENEDLDEFIARFDELMQNLKATGAVIKDEDAVGCVLKGLPKSYEATVKLLENMPIESVSLDVVKAKLKGETEKRKLNKPDNGDEREPLASCSYKPGGDGNDTSSINRYLVCIQDQGMEIDKTRSDKTFRGTVKKVSRLQKTWSSSIYCLFNLPWKFKVIPKMPGREHPHSLQFCIECNREDKLPSWSNYYVTAQLRLLPCKSDGKAFITKIQHFLCNKESDWEFSHSMLWQDVEGFIKDDSITLEGCVNVYKQE